MGWDFEGYEYNWDFAVQILPPRRSDGRPQRFAIEAAKLPETVLGFVEEVTENRRLVSLRSPKPVFTSCLNQKASLAADHVLLCAEVQKPVFVAPVMLDADLPTPGQGIGKYLPVKKRLGRDGEGLQQCVITRCGWPGKRKVGNAGDGIAAAENQLETSELAVVEVEALDDKLAVAGDEEPMATLEGNRDTERTTAGRGLVGAGVDEQTVEFQVTFDADGCGLVDGCLADESPGRYLVRFGQSVCLGFPANRIAERDGAMELLKPVG